MASISLPHNAFSEDTTWESLKQAIAASSGFQRWSAERALKGICADDLNLDQLVTRYLKETLETLAY